MSTFISKVANTFSRKAKYPPIKRTAAVNELIAMHVYRRPKATATESYWINRHLVPLGGAFDRYGNFIVRVGDQSANRVMFSSHTDTVHIAEGTQLLKIDGNILSLAATSKSNCLGADCTVGVWIMMEMIRTKVPGLYVFHRAEEVGRLGSEWIVRNTPELTDGIDLCVAFDRRGDGDIITHQCSERTASESFAADLSGRLKIFGLNYAGCEFGSYTDSYSYRRLIPECTNLSVGYSGAHSSRETLDLRHALMLRNAACSIRWATLVAERNPATEERRQFVTQNWTPPRSIDDYRSVDLFGLHLERNSKRKVTVEEEEIEEDIEEEEEDGTSASSSQTNYEKLFAYLKKNPGSVADMLDMEGYTVDDLKQHADLFG